MPRAADPSRTLFDWMVYAIVLTWTIIVCVVI
jgi:hypothetical protein